MEEKKPRQRAGISQVCKRYNRTPTTIWNWYKTGDFPLPHYINGYRHWWTDELDDYDRKHAQTYEQRQAGVR